MSYNKKYKIMDVMINKQLKGDEIVLKHIPKDFVEQPTIKELILSLTDKVNEQSNRLDKIESRLDGIDIKLINLDTRINNLVKNNNLIE
jgi:hypothetical protein